MIGWLVTRTVERGNAHRFWCENLVKSSLLERRDAYVKSIMKQFQTEWNSVN